VLATKVHGAMRKGPNGGGLSRKAIMVEIDNSLRRLGVDYVDLYQIHRWDKRTPIEETMEALHDVVKSGKALHIGASSMYAWQFSKAQYLAERNGWTKFVTMQNHYNLLYREEEREMLPLCGDQGIGVIPWSPLARGKLTRDWDAVTARSETDAFGRTLYDTSASDRVIAEVEGQTVYDALADPALGRDLLDRLRGTTGLDLLTVLDEEPTERWSALIREEVLRWCEARRPERLRAVGGFLDGLLGRPGTTYDLAESLIAVLLELPPPPYADMVASIVHVNAGLASQDQERLRAVIGSAMARFAIPQWQRLAGSLNAAESAAGRTGGWR